MFLKLFDDTATMKLVNIGLAQSIEKYEPEKELSAKELKETKNIPEILKKGIRVIWNDQIQKENAETEDCYYSEQIFYGISFEQLTELLNNNSLYIRPIQKELVEPAAEKAVEPKLEKKKTTPPVKTKTQKPKATKEKPIVE